MSKINLEELKFQQIEAAFRQIKERGLKSGLRDIYEFGTYKGESLKKICGYIRDIIPSPYPFVYAFDSFDGLPKEDEGIDLFEKFQEGAYKFDLNVEPCTYIKNKVNYPFLFVFKTLFSDIKYKISMLPAILVHIDCDIYSSTIDALTFMFDNKLILEGTLIAYDEFRSTETLSGEEAAHIEVLKKYNAEAEEIWHYTYRDKSTGQKIRQSVWEIIKVGITL